jgi:hypothetical protein
VRKERKETAFSEGVWIACTLLILPARFAPRRVLEAVLEHVPLLSSPGRSPQWSTPSLCYWAVGG